MIRAVGTAVDAIVREVQRCKHYDTVAVQLLFDFFGEMKDVFYQIGPVSYTHLVSGVGISFGADRIFDVWNQLELYPKEAVNGTEVLFINFGEKERCV